MKFEFKSFGTRPNTVSFTNTPLGCIVYDSDGNFQFAGLNLTDEGEFVQAPGLGDAKIAGTVAISQDAARSCLAELKEVRRTFISAEFPHAVIIDRAIAELEQALGVTP